MREGDAKRLRGLEVEYQLVLGRGLHWQIGRLLALEDSIDVAGGAAVLVDLIWPVGDQAAAGDEKPFGVDCGQSMLVCEGDDQIAMPDRGSTQRNNDAAVGLAGKIRQRTFDPSDIARVNRA